MHSIFLFATSFVFFLCYSLILLIPCTSLKRRFPKGLSEPCGCCLMSILFDSCFAPSTSLVKRSFYFYAVFFALFSLIECIGCIMIFSGSNFGLWYAARPVRSATTKARSNNDAPLCTRVFSLSSTYSLVDVSMFAYLGFFSILVFYVVLRVRPIIQWTCCRLPLNLLCARKTGFLQNESFRHAVLR